MYCGGRTVIHTPTAPNGWFRGGIRSQGSREGKTTTSCVPNFGVNPSLPWGADSEEEYGVSGGWRETILGIFLHLPD